MNDLVLAMFGHTEEIAEAGIVSFLIYIAIALAIAYLTTPKPKLPKPPKPTGLEEFEIPTAEEGRPVQVLFGKRRIKGPNVVWYGDLKSEAIWK